MSNWTLFCPKIPRTEQLDLASLREMAAKKFDRWGVYPDSMQVSGETFLFLVREKVCKQLILIGNGPVYEAFTGNEILVDERMVKVCDLTHPNAVALRKAFPFTAPTAVLKQKKTMGLGDRLGVASAGHIRLLRSTAVKPILAQQSIRELNLTGRTYPGVLDDVSWAVFQEGYTGGFGADGDHLKKPEEIQMALDCGFTMITLDCSDYIDNQVTNLSDQEVNSLYYQLDDRSAEAYLHQDHLLKSGDAIRFDSRDIKRIVLTYQKAIAYAISIYQSYIKPSSREVDFEISIDETHTPTSPQAHYYVAAELRKQDILPATIAPRFCGEFQKGIDYMGDLVQFEKEFILHTAIADHFGYKLSIHSGSDKFAVFPIIGRITGGHYHVKTAGTNWLEAVRVIARKAPELYREMHQFALEGLPEARKYYHIKGQEVNVPNMTTLQDSDLPGLMDQDDARQIIHIAYGLILKAENNDGSPRFRQRIHEVLFHHEHEFYQGLENHIGKHVTLLGN